MSKYVSDTKAARSLRGILVMKGSKVIAKVTSYHGNSCLVNVFQHGKALERSAKARKVPLDAARSHDDARQLNFQHGRASGYGYDKWTAALSGLIIDGHEMTNHCGKRLPYPKGLDYFPADFKAPRGWRLANYFSAGKESFVRAGKTPDVSGY